MSSQYIPKEQLTAYERWEMAAFDEAERMTIAMRQAEAGHAAAVQQSNPPLAAVAATPSPLDEAELAALRQQARDAGHAEGFEAGRTEGYADGAAMAKAEAAHMAALARDFTLSIEASETGLADAVLQLSLDLAAQMICTSLQVRRELVLPVVREAIAALANPHGHPSLLIHPDDAGIVREHLGDTLAHSSWRILEDAQIPRGGCRVENGGAEIDATLVTRWRRVIETLGQQTDWIDPQ